VPTIEKPQSDSIFGSVASPTLGAQIEVVTGFLRRRYWLILIGLLLSAPFGALYLRLTPATYTASATTLIESRKNPFDALLGSNAMPDFAWVESQIGVLRSRNVAAIVVKQLRLADDPTFIRSGYDPLDQFLARFGWGEPDPKSEPERVEGAIAALNNGLKVQRLGPSYLVRIDFSSPNKELAVKIANAVTDAYVFDQLNAKFQANRRAGDWLQERLQALREQASAAERAVVEFKAKNNIVPAGGGTVMSEKELSQMSNGLVSARVAASEIQLRLERIEAVRKAYQKDKPDPSAEQDETVSEAMSSAIITGLRTRYLDLVNREADWSVRYGKNHTAVVKLRTQIREIRRSIYEELGRIEENFKSEYAIAKKRQDEYEKGLAGLASLSTNNQAQVTLFSLEAAAQSYRRLYDNFLQRHTESVQQQTFPITEARQVSAASATKTGPKTLQIWAVTIFAGGMIGLGFGALRELMDRKFRTREQVQSLLATECLAVVPMLADTRRKGIFSRQQSIALERTRRGEFAIDRGPRSIGFIPKSMWTVINSPSSEYAEAIRSIKLMVDLNSRGNDTKIVGLTSCLPSEGKSTLAAAMATLIAQGGARVILLDCDLRHPSLSRVLAPDASAGFVDVVAGEVELADAIWTDPNTQMAFLPAGANVPNATEILASEAAKSLIHKLQIGYDYVIVDLAPIAAGIDVRVTSDFIGSYLLVVEWGATKIDAVQYALRAAPTVHGNLAGVVLNKVDMSVMGHYDRLGANYYYGQPRRLRSLN